MADYDEFLLPQDGSVDLFHFMAKRDNDTVNSFNFRMAYLMNGLPEIYSPVPSGVSEYYGLFLVTTDLLIFPIPENTYLYTQMRIGRVFNTSHYLPHHIRSKFITKTKYSVELGNHFLFKGVEGTSEYKLELDEGMSYHYRDFWGYPFCTIGNTTHDFTARIYGRSLWSKVDQVCGEVFEGGVCSLGTNE
jgi:hypothetical protein